MKIAGVVVLYNPDEKVARNIETYIGQLGTLYIVDNSSCDNGERFKFCNAVYIPNMDNIGIAEALNIGAKRAIKDGYEWLLTMDQDSHFTENAVADMCKFLEDIKTDKELQKQANSTYDEIGLISPFHRMETNKDEKVSGIDSPAVLMTSGNIISLSAYQKIGGFKGWMFIDAVDFDYCMNLRHNKYSVLRLNFVELNHNLGDKMTVNNVLGKKICNYNHSPIRRYYIVRNRHYFYDMYHEEFPEYCNLELKCTKKEALKVIAFEDHKIKKLLAMYKGYSDYKKGIKGKKPQ